METLVLENGTLRVEFAPQFGGKIISIQEHRTGLEYLLPPANPYGRIDQKLRFEDSDRGGFDECLPSVSACSTRSDFPRIPDHGELWYIPWHVLETSPRVSLAAQGTHSGLELKRSISLDKNRMNLHYELINRSKARRPWLWSSHPLLNVEPGDQILLPSEVTEVVTDYAPKLGLDRGARIGWPRCSESVPGVDLSSVGDPDGFTALKLFAFLKHTGRCGLRRKQHDRILLFRFDPQQIPFVGLWICREAWPENGETKQFTVALEPCTAPYDSLDLAIISGSARYLAPDERATWDLTIEIVKSDWSSID